jgi:cardiolipin synthase A/B
MVSAQWQEGNQVTLLENGEAFFPAVFEAIRQARSEVILETFIWFEDKVGLELREVLVDAARRGVQCDVLVDGFGSGDLTPEFVASMTDVGVRIRSFSPLPRILGMRFNVLRRMHRKIVVVDGQRAFVGGINYSADHLGDFGPQAKQDYSVELVGPVVDDIHRFVLEAIQRPRRMFRRRPAAPTRAPSATAGSAMAMFVTRDNTVHTNDIERHYRLAIRAARQRVVIANAYFFPGYRLLREMRRAARRGVEVHLILQGEPDMPIVKTAASLLYEHLQRDGVKIHEYCRRPLHGKVALVDDEWATVGSSNLDPLSLSLNLEANVVLRDKSFVRALAERLEHLMAHECQAAKPPPPRSRWSFWPQMRSAVVFHFLRHFPAWASWLPRHAPELKPLHASGQGLPVDEQHAGALEPLSEPMVGGLRGR